MKESRRLWLCFFMLVSLSVGLLFYSKLDWRQGVVASYEEEENSWSKSAGRPLPKHQLYMSDREVNKSTEKECGIPNDGRSYLVKDLFSFEESLAQTPLLCSETNKPLHLTHRQVIWLRSRRYFVALNLFNNENVAPHLFSQMIKLMRFLSKRIPNNSTNEDCIDEGTPTYENIFVSIFENDSKDRTVLHTKLFEEKVRELGIAHRFVLDSHAVTSYRSNHSINRIDFMAEIRNKAMEPLYQDQEERFDQVFFLNDIYFCWQDAIRLLINPDIDMACGMDTWWDSNNKLLQFYDSWVARDSNGNGVSSLYPFFKEERDLQLFYRKLPIPVYCCWNGMVALNASAFYPPHNIRFRRAYPFQESQVDNSSVACDSAECSNLCFDFFKHGLMNAYIDPHVLVGYEKVSFEQSLTFDFWRGGVEESEILPYSHIVPTHAIPLTRQFPPSELCCPVPMWSHNTLVYPKCYIKEYNSTGNSNSQSNSNSNNNNNNNNNDDDDDIDIDNNSIHNVIYNGNPTPTPLANTPLPTKNT